MLAFYAGKLGAVEINNTFYRMPTPDAARALGGGDAGGVSLRAQEPAPDHPHEEAGRRRRRRRRGSRRRRARSATGWARSCFSSRRSCARISAVLEAFLRDAAAGGCAPRSSSATRRGSPTTSTTSLRRARRRRSASPIPRSWRRRSRRRRAGATCGCAGRTTTRRRCDAGPSACGPALRRQRTSSSSTRTRARGPRLPIRSKHDDLTFELGPGQGGCQIWHVSHLGLHWHTPWREQSQARPSRSGWSRFR